MISSRSVSRSRLIELILGVIVGNAFNLQATAWLTFVASFAGVVLTFLAGAEVDVPLFRREWRASIVVGALSFLAGGRRRAASLLGARLDRRAAEICGVALSTTSLAVVYAVLVETGLNQTLVGKRLMSATFVTDLLTVAALSVLFITPTVWIVPFVAVSLPLISACRARPAVLRSLRRSRDRARDQAHLRVALCPDVARRSRNSQACCPHSSSAWRSRPTMPRTGASNSGCASWRSRS